MASNILDQEDDETEILQFNLTNPEQLTEQLKHAELDDQETDVLLKEALRINAQLKKALRMQQLEEDEVGTLKKPSDGKGRGHFGPAEPLAPRNPRQSSLPPIVSKHDKHGGGNSRQGSKDQKSKSLVNGQRMGSASKRKSSASKSRPAWDDRFAFN